MTFYKSEVIRKAFMCLHSRYPNCEGIPNGKHFTFFLAVSLPCCLNLTESKHPPSPWRLPLRSFLGSHTGKLHIPCQRCRLHGRKAENKNIVMFTTTNGKIGKALTTYGLLTLQCWLCSRRPSITVP